MILHNTLDLPCIYAHTCVAPPLSNSFVLFLFTMEVMNIFDGLSQNFFQQLTDQGLTLQYNMNHKYQGMRITKI